MTAPAPVGTPAGSISVPMLYQSDLQVPDYPHPAFVRTQPLRDLCQTLMIGTPAIRDGGVKYLPMRAGEDADDYAYRKQLCAVFPGFARTVKAAVGLINQTPPVLGDDMPDELIDFAENVDLAGTHLNVFAKALSKAGIVDGYAGILVDYQRPDDPSVDRSRASAAAVPGATLSADDEQRLGLRPYWILIKADDCIKPVYETVAGVRTLVQLIVRELSLQRLGQFGMTTTLRYRVYERRPNGSITYELWERKFGQAISQLVMPAMTVQNLTEIPWAPFGAGDEVEADEWHPPLMDLANLNIEHHRTKTNLAYLIDTACVPTQVRIGAQKNAEGEYPEIVLGPRQTIEAPYIEGITKPVYWHSPDVTVLDPGARTLTDIKQDMGSAGLAFLAPDSRSAETAAAKRIDSTAQNATITTVAGRQEDCLERAFFFTGQYLRTPAGSVTVNTDFENTVMDAQMVAALGALAANGKLDIETLLDLLEQGHILADGADKQAIIKRILAENAANNPAPDPNNPADPAIARAGGTPDNAAGGDTKPDPAE